MAGCGVNSTSSRCYGCPSLRGRLLHAFYSDLPHVSKVSTCKNVQKLGTKLSTSFLENKCIFKKKYIRPVKQSTALSAVRGFLFWPPTTLTHRPACCSGLSLCIDFCIGFPMLAVSMLTLSSKLLFTRFSLPLEVELFILLLRFQVVLYQV